VRFLEARSAHLNQVIFDFQTRRGIVVWIFLAQPVQAIGDRLSPKPPYAAETHSRALVKWVSFDRFGLFSAEMWDAADSRPFDRSYGL